MNYDKEREPIYENKAKQVLSELAEGKSKEEVALNAGYKSFTALSNYMRRKNFSWVGKENKFIPTIEKNAPHKSHLYAVENPRVSKIISLYQDKDNDAKQIAEEAGFDSHKKMAKFMESEGYRWDSEIKNYAKVARDKKKNEIQNDEEKYDFIDGKGDEFKYSQDFEKYRNVLELIRENEEQLRDVLDPANRAGKISQYALPGIPRTKSIHMVNTLDELGKSFCSDKNINQRVLYESALIEYLSKYGYKTQVDQLLNS